MSKLDDDAFTRVRIILMHGLGQGLNRFLHMAARFNGDIREPLARVRRSSHHMQTMTNWLLPPDDSPIETTIGYEQVAIEVTASVAQHEPDDYLAQNYRFGLLEDFDHLYRYSALLDRLEGKDPNDILQSYTDIAPGRPTWFEHRDPADDLRTPYDRNTAHPLSKLHALTIYTAEYQTRDFYMTVGPMYTDPVARAMYAEIASMEEQHVTQYESMVDPNETWLEKWLLHHGMMVYNYYSCMQYEENPRIKAIWERCLDYQLGQLQVAMKHFKDIERRDPEEILPKDIPEPINFTAHRDFIRKVLEEEVELTAYGHEFMHKDKAPPNNRSDQYRDYMNKDGSPTEIMAEGYQWRPGTEVTAEQPLRKAL